MTGTWAPCLCLLLLSSAVLSKAADIPQLLEGDKRGASDRRLLHTDDSASTVFGEPPPGTLVVTWSALPAKRSPDFWGDMSPPDEYGWFSTYEVYVDRAWLVFRPVDAYVAGPGNKTTRLIAAGSCNLTTTDYPDVNSLYNDCKGQFSVPTDLTVTEVWMLLEAPKGRAFRVPTPFDGFNCTAPLFVGNQQATYKPETFAAAFDFGPIPLGESALPGGPTNTGLFTILSLYSQPFDQPGNLTFESINMRLTYEPVALTNGSTLGWLIPYTACTFAGKQLQTIRSEKGTPAPTLIPMLPAPRSRTRGKEPELHI